MALKVGDRVKQTSTTTGTGTITLNGTAPTGFSNFRDYLSDGDTTYYVIEDGTNYEIGVGTFNTGGSATADTIARSSDANVYRSTSTPANSNNRIDWSSGTRSVFISLPSDKAVFEDALGDLSFTGDVNFGGASGNAMWDYSISYLQLFDNSRVAFGNGYDLQLHHKSTDNNSYIENNTGVLYITQKTNDSDIILSSDDGSGGTTAYVTLDGGDETVIVHKPLIANSTITASGRIIVDDTTNATSTTDGSLQTDGGLSVVKDIVVGDDILVGDNFALTSDASIIYFGADSEITLTHIHNTGLRLNSSAQLQFGDGGTYIHQSADGVLDLVSDTEIEINATTVDLNGALEIPDSSSGGIVRIGTGDDLQIYHNGTNTVINNITGNLFLIQGADDSDVYFQCDDQTGGQATYIWLDGSEGEVKLLHASSGSYSTKLTTKSTGVDVTGAITTDGLTVDGTTTFNDDVTFTGASYNVQWDKSANTLNLLDVAQLHFGSSLSSGDLRIFHNLTDSFVQNTSGNFNIINYANDKDIIFSSDDGSGGTTAYITLDGSSGEVLLNRYNSTKLTTKSTGVDVTGTLEADGGTFTGDVTLSNDANLVIENNTGSSPLRYTTITPASSTFNRTITLPDNTGTVYLRGESMDSDLTLTNNADLVLENNTGSSPLRYTTLTAESSTFNRTATLPDATGTIFIKGQNMDTNLTLTNNADLVLENNTGSSPLRYTTITPASSTFNRIITLPDATGTVITTGNANAGATTTSSSDADHVLIDDGGVLKKITPANLGISGGGGALTGTGLTLTSTDAGSADGPTITLKRDSASPGNFDDIGEIEFLGENSASEEIRYGHIKTQITNPTDGAEESRMVFSIFNDGADKEMMFLDANQGGGVVYLTAGIDLLFEGPDSSKETTLTVETPTADRTITLPDATGIVLTTGNSNEPTTTTNSNHAEFVLIDHSGTMKKITPANLGIGGSVAADNITTGDSAVNIATTTGNITIDAQGNDTDIIFKGTDGGSDITALTLDMSNDGTAIFNNNVNLSSDGAVLKFGADSEVTVNHVHNTGLKLNSTNQFQFGDSGTYIHQSADGVLDLVADTELELNGGIVDINSSLGDINIGAVGGNAIISGDTGEMTLTNSGTGNIIIDSSGNDTDIVFKGKHGNSAFTALTIDMSQDGAIVSRPSTATNNVFGNVSIDSAFSNLAIFRHYNHIGNNNSYSIAQNAGGKTYINSVAGNDMSFRCGNVEKMNMSTSGDLVANGNITAYSDERLKSNIKTIDNALDKVTKLRGVSYTKEDKQGIGVIAQEVEKVIPEVVIDGKYKSVAYGNMVGVLIEAMKEQQKQIDEQQKQIDELKKLIG